MPFEAVDRASSSASNSVSRGDTGERNESTQCEDGGPLIHMESSSPCPIQPPVPPLPTQYVLSPAPSFDLVFDDLLEGGSGTATVHEYVSTKSESSTSLEELTRKIDYLNELYRDEQMLHQLPGFRHSQMLLGREIKRIRKDLRLHRTPVARIDNVIQPERPARILSEGKFNLGSFHEMTLSKGPVVTVVGKVYPPIERHPEYNFIGRLIGPRGRTVKQIEQESGCLVTIRGRGSETKGKHYRKWGQFAYENETEPLHVRIEATNHQERAQFMVDRAKELIQKLLVPVDDDELKQRQLRELSLIRYGDRLDQGQMQPTNVHYPNLSGTVAAFTQPLSVQFMTPMVGLYPGVVFVDASVTETEASGVDSSSCERTGWRQV